MTHIVRGKCNINTPTNVTVLYSNVPALFLLLTFNKGQCRKKYIHQYKYIILSDCFPFLLLYLKWQNNVTPLWNRMRPYVWPSTQTMAWDRTFDLSHKQWRETVRLTYHTNHFWQYCDSAYSRALQNTSL